MIVVWNRAQVEREAGSAANRAAVVSHAWWYSPQAQAASHNSSTSIPRKTRAVWNAWSGCLDTRPQTSMPVHKLMLIPPWWRRRRSDRSRKSDVGTGVFCFPDHS
jgi:hypothetical protein